MKFREKATKKSGAKAGAKSMAMASSAAKKVAAAKKSTPPRKAAPAKKPAAKKVPKPATAKKSAPSSAKKPALAAVKPAAAAKPAAPRLATPLYNSGEAPVSKAPEQARPAAAPMGRPAAVTRSGAQSPDEARKAATRKVFARLRSLEAIIGADLRKRGSVVLMQAVDQWYNEAISASATDVSITNAAKAVIAQL